MIPTLILVGIVSSTKSVMLGDQKKKRSSPSGFVQRKTVQAHHGSCPLAIVLPELTIIGLIV